MARSAEAAAAKSRPVKTVKAANEQETVEQALPNLDRIIHEKTRLAIVSALAVNASLTFSELKAILKTTDGNISVHARKLEDASPGGPVLVMIGPALADAAQAGTAEGANAAPTQESRISVQGV